MTHKLTATLLGTGSSGGVPRVGGDWGDCDPDEPKNRRLRCSLLVALQSARAVDPTQVLIDTAPDLREQFLTAEVKRLDGVVFSHDHADQTHGIDDLRAIVYRMRKRLPAYLDQETSSSLLSKFRYVFEGEGGYPPILQAQDLISPGHAFRVDGPAGQLEILPLRQIHGSIVSLGFRIGPLAYCNDVSALPHDTMEQLRCVDTFIVDALRHTPHPSHAHLDLALEWAREIGARRTILTNLHVDMDYQTLVRDLPASVEPAYDGLTVELGYTTT